MRQIDQSGEYLMVERRRYQRYNITQDCMVRHADAMGLIVDLSRGGLSCECVNSEEQLSSSCKEVDLLCLGSSMSVKALTLDVISSEKIPGKFMSGMYTRKCRASFASLRDEQTAFVESLIHACVARTLPPSEW